MGPGRWLEQQGAVVGSGGRHESGDVSCWVLLGACAAHDLHRTLRRRRQGQGDGGRKESSTEHERPLKKREEVEHQRHGETLSGVGNSGGCSAARQGKTT